MHSNSGARATPAVPARSDPTHEIRVRRARRSSPRRWRRRGQRAQVAPVATILGLLLVVTFLATYLSTTLPNQMSINDLNHDVLVQNQVSQLATVVDSVANVGVVGAQATFPISLGSAGTPPFAGPDSSSIVPLSNNYTGIYALFVNYSVTTSSSTLALSAASSPGSGFVVSLHNTYADAAEVAYDDGAVIFAQPGGVPTMEDPPAITLSGTSLSITMPVFRNGIGSESGTATAQVGFRLIAVQSFNLPVSGYSLASGSTVKITAYTPYAAAWVNYFNSTSGFAGDVACLPHSVGTSSVCSPSYAYRPGGAIGEVIISLPAATLSTLSIQQAYFSVTLG